MPPVPGEDVMVTASAGRGEPGRSSCPKPTDWSVVPAPVPLARGRSPPMCTRRPQERPPPSPQRAASGCHNPDAGPRTHPRGRPRFPAPGPSSPAVAQQSTLPRQSPSGLHRTGSGSGCSASPTSSCTARATAGNHGTDVAGSTPPPRPLPSRRAARTRRPSARAGLRGAGRS
jgi:hypothetical protein